MQTTPDDAQQSNLSIAECLQQSSLDKLETRILLMHVTGYTRIQLITRSDTLLSSEQVHAVQTLIQRRLNGEPVAYLTGEREFFGLSFHTTPDVLIPRADTELLVELALQYAPENSTLLDMGTGSGAIAIALAHSRPNLRITAVDISINALQIAEGNAQQHQTERRIRFLQSNWYSALDDTLFHTIVSNPPYIVSNDPHLSQGDLRFEPINALTDHADGLTAYRHLIANARQHLMPGGYLLMEHGYDQAAAVRQLLIQADFLEVQSWRDLAGIERVSGARLPY
ncbi:peptide chain release factor N(5)-glutamine methyltransferase [Undibacterium sp. SXout7W]|uniref:peptide chain release factor N(5)-glutamine methyltransferase n=1 Tax=Undibacterium sp. SXout7W TaxID=3413049 RepID=UPI003BEF858E